jgi:predicted AAA+ superfamily ATPase
MVPAVLDFALDYHLPDGDLWADYAAYQLMLSENPYTRVAERGRADAGQTLTEFADRDLEIWRGFVTKGTDFSALLRAWNAPSEDVGAFSGAGVRIRALSRKLLQARNTAEFRAVLAQYYAIHGAGRYGLHHIFRLGDEAERGLVPLRESGVKLDDLVGLDAQKAALSGNIDRFLAGKGPMHTLLYGDAGTGKSTLVRTLVTHYGDRGLRLIEVPKHLAHRLPQLVGGLEKRRHGFVLLLDDLSFENGETGYKFLKSALEGGAGAWPPNVLIIATSNRRHLVSETWEDARDTAFTGDKHRSETAQEKQSLAARFGLQLFFESPTPPQYRALVAELLTRQGLAPSAEHLRAADAFAMRQGGRTSRAAVQFAETLQGA